MSVSQAAEDLCVTQSAISKQLRTLEDLLGVRLLQRGHRQISFTFEGARLFRAADASVQQLQDVLGTFGNCSKRPVTISASTGVSSLWLVPQLGDFQRAHPGVDLRVAASNSVIDLASENIELAIRYCPDSQAPEGAIKLFGETIAPVASPAISRSSLSSLRSLREHVLLEFEDRRPWLQWQEWLSGSGWHTSQARGMLRFNHYDQVIHAAVAGQGVALGRMEILAPLLKDGRLQRVDFDGTVCRSSCSYWLVQASADPRADVLHVIDWLRSSPQAKQHKHFIPSSAIPFGTL
jgi:DNA-binding transcriptional LysR family regulator